MKKNKPKVSHVSFKPKPIVLAVKHALPYLVALSLGAAVISPAVGRSGDSAAAFTATQLIRQFTLKNTVAQVSQGMQGYVAEFNGVLRASEMGGVVSGYPVDMGSVPSSVNLPQRDGAGRPLGYCAWDNSASTSNSSFLAGQGVANPLVYAVVSPGLNGGMETSCAYILANRSGLGDDYVQVTAPSQTSSKQFKSAVGTYAELTAMPGEEGDIRLVLETNKLYSYVGGGWQPVDASKFNDDSAVNGAGAIAYTTGKVTVADFQAASATITGALSGSAATFTSSVTANSFVGNGAALTDLNASNVNSGLLGAAFGGTGVDSSAAAQGSLLIGTGAGFALGAISAGDGIGVVNGAGSITISNTGVLSITGTNNQVIASAMNGDVVLSLPQDIASTSTPTFGGLIVNGGFSGTTATFADAVSATRLDVSDPSGGVTNANLAVGANALRLAQSGEGANTALGIQALYSNTTGTANTAVGRSSLYSNTTGVDNTAVGRNALNENTTGSYNTALGAEAGSRSATQFLENGSNNTFIGAWSGPTSGRTSSNYSTAIGAFSEVGTDNTIVLGRTIDTTVIGATGTATSGILQNKILQVTGDVGVTGALTIGGAFSTTGSVTGAGLQITALLGLTDINPGPNAIYQKSALDIAVDGGITGRMNSNDFWYIGRSPRSAVHNSNDDGGLYIMTGDGKSEPIIFGQFNFNESMDSARYLTLMDSSGNTALAGDLTAPGNITLSGALNGVSVKTITSGLTNPSMAIGGGNLLATHTGTGSTLAIGFSALANLTTGAENVAIGYNSMQNTTAGDRNVALGAFTLRANTTGSDNTALGHRALSANTTGNANTGLGDSTLRENTIGYRNTAAGENAMRFNIDGYENSAYGMDSLHSNISGNRNTAIGRSSMYANTTGNFNTAVGENTLSNNISGSWNVAISPGSLMSNTTGYGNTAVGHDTLKSNVDGFNMVAIGRYAMDALTTGSDNIAIGVDALTSATSGSRNTMVGTNGGQDQTIAEFNAGLGYDTLRRVTTGGLNTAMGSYSLDRVTTGERNTALGYGAGGNSTNGVTTGSYNTFLGFEAQPGTTTQLSYATAIGASARVNTSGTIVLGRTTDTTVIGATGAATSGNLLGGKLQVTGDIRASGNVYAAGVQLTSDRRLKTDINQIDNDLILNNLAKLNAYKYRLVNDPTGQVRVGVIAQELAALLPELAQVGVGGYYSVDYSALGTLAAAGVGRLSVQFDTLNKTVEQQGKDITTIKTRLDGVDTRVTQLEGWKTEAVGRMDKMQSAIDLNIEKIAANALAIASNTEKITTLEQITQQIDSRLLTAEGTLAKVEADWKKSFSHSDDGQTLTVKTPNLVASNFSAEQIRSRAAYTERLGAEMAKIRMLEVDSLKANTAVARNIQAETVNTGSVQVYAGVGLPALLFAASADGHYTVNTSALDGSYATATVIVNAGQAKVISMASEGIELYAEGNQVKAIAAGKSIKVSWIKMG